MTTLLWLLGFLGTSWVNYWILAMDGAKKIEGWLSFFVVGWFALDWHAEQIRLYVLIIWLAQTVWFVVGVFVPELRFLGG